MKIASKRFRTQDSTLAYFVNQLENFDQTIHQPLTSVTWSRDIDLRPNVSLSSESTSFTRQSFAAPGTLANSSNMPFVSAETTALPGVMVGGQKITTPLRQLAREISYTSVELMRSQLIGQPIDLQQLYALNTSFQMNTDQMVYIGSSDVSATGLFNSADVTTSTVPNGVSGSPLWANKNADEIVADVNNLLVASWNASGQAVCPSILRLPPVQFAQISSAKVSSAGNVSILKYIQDNSISQVINGKALDIQSVKWLTGAGPGPVDRMAVYTKNLDYVRFPMVMMQRETAYYRGLRFFAPYQWGFGEVEIVYPETIRYADGI